MAVRTGPDGVSGTALCTAFWSPQGIAALRAGSDRDSTRLLWRTVREVQCSECISMMRTWTGCKQTYGGFHIWGYPQSSSILMEVSIINHPAIGVPPWWKPRYLNCICQKTSSLFTITCLAGNWRCPSLCVSLYWVNHKLWWQPCFRPWPQPRTYQQCPNTDFHWRVCLLPLEVQLDASLHLNRVHVDANL